MPSTRALLWSQVTVPEGHEVIRQHAAGDQFYIVEHGKLGAYVSTAGQPEPARPVMLYGPGSYFGELALLRNEPRAATVCEAMRGLAAVLCVKCAVWHLCGRGTNG